MKVLILSITAGEGHNSTAKAIEAGLKEKGIEAQFLDAYEYVSEFLKEAFANGYVASANNSKRLYSEMYKIAENRRQNSNTKSMMRTANTIIAKKLIKFIDAYEPDAIVFTHPFLGVVMDYLKQKELVKVPTIGIVTDFTVHPYWEEALYIDYIVTANELLTRQAMLKGFKKEQILPLGIPIHPKFAKSESAETVRERLGLDPNKLTLLIMGGSMGYGHMEKTIKELDELERDFQMIIVCGTNARAKNKIDALDLKKKALVYGYVTNVDELMDAATIIVTKPGGLTSSEALAKKLPMLICDPIPGQEMRNTEFFTNAGVAVAATKTLSISETVYRIFALPERFSLMEQCIELIRKPNATNDVCDFIISLLNNK